MLNLGIISVIALTAIVIVLALKTWQFFNQKTQLHRLVDQGISTTGIVTRKKRYALGNVTSRYLHYTFKASNGRRYRRAIEVSKFIWGCYETGMPIDVVFLPEAPSINSTQYLVSEIQKMMCG